MNVPRVRVMCVDDNELVAESIGLRLRAEPSVEWLGWLFHPDDLLSGIQQARPDVLLLDVDMPGHDAFELLRNLNITCPDIRTLMFSGHGRPDYVDRAIAAGAWGYVSKNESVDELLAAIHKVVSGEFALSDDLSSLHLNTG